MCLLLLLVSFWHLFPASIPASEAPGQLRPEGCTSAGKSPDVLLLPTTLSKHPCLLGTGPGLAPAQASQQVWLMHT